MADMKAANATSLDQYKAMSGAVSDSLKLVTFAAPLMFLHCAAANRW